MINFKQYIKYLNNNEVSSEEMILLYILNFGNDKDIFLLSKTYIDNNKSKINYSFLLKRLEEKDFLTNFNKVDQIQLSKIKINDWVKEKYFVSKDVSFDEVFELYPKTVMYKGIGYPSFTTIEESQRIYFDRVHAGIKTLHDRFIEITTNYLKLNKFTDYAPMKFNKWLDGFESLAIEYEKQHHESNFYDALNR